MTAFPSRLSPVGTKRNYTLMAQAAVLYAAEVERVRNILSYWPRRNG